eukprot:gene879-biopygen724
MEFRVSIDSGRLRRAAWCPLLGLAGGVETMPTAMNCEPDCRGDTPNEEGKLKPPTLTPPTAAALVVATPSPPSAVVRVCCAAVVMGVRLSGPP